MNANLDIQISCVGLNHNTAPSAFREKVYLDNEELFLRLQKVKEKFKDHEFFAVSTCNRFELFTASKGHPTDKNFLLKAFQDIQRDNSNELKDFLYFYHDKMAINHFIHVTASLDSIVLGETQITGQIKKSLDFVNKNLISGPILQRLGQVALRTAKTIRTNTDIGKKTVSVSHTAFSLANRVFDRLENKEIWVVGAGEMAEVALSFLANKKASNVGIANRTLGKASELANRFGISKVHALHNLPEILSSADVILFAVNTPKEILTHSILKNSLRKQTPQKPIVVLDIGIPRVVDPNCRDIEQVFLFDMDDIQEAVVQNKNQRQQSAQQAAKYVKRSSESFAKWLQQKKMAEPLALYQTYLEELFSKNLERSKNRKSFKDLPQQSLADIQNLLTSIQSKILSDVARNLKDESIHPVEWLDFIQTSMEYEDE